MHDYRHDMEGQVTVLERDLKVCIPGEGNLGNVLLISRNPLKYFYQWILTLKTEYV